jgi:hypothetical protein
MFEDEEIKNELLPDNPFHSGVEEKGSFDLSIGPHHTTRLWSFFDNLALVLLALLIFVGMTIIALRPSH